MTNKQEAQNWIKVAGKFVDREEAYTCHAVHRTVPSEEAHSMMLRFWGDRGDEFIPLEWNDDTLPYGGKDIRALYCLFMALECDPNCLD